MEDTKQELTKEQINKLTQSGDSHNFNADSDLFYENQTPIVAYLVLEGRVQLFQGPKLKKSISPGTLFGVQELINHGKTKYSAKVKENSVICFIGLSTIKEILSNKENELSTVLSDIGPITADNP